MGYTNFNEYRFRDSLETAMKQVKSILDNTRNPRLAENEDHTYADKFVLCEFLTNTAIASQMTAFEKMGLDVGKLHEISEDWVHKDKKNVILRFQAHDSCFLLKEQDVEQVFNFEHTTETSTQFDTTSVSGGLGSSQKTKTIKKRIETKVTEYHWNVEVSYRIMLFPGTDTSKAVALDRRTSSTIVVTSADQYGQKNTAPPIPKYTQHPNIDVDVTWFFRMISADQVCQFSIDRSSSSEKGEKRTCKTPRRNEDVDNAFEFNKQLCSWALDTGSFFVQRVENTILGQHNPVNKTPPTASPEDTIHPPSTRAVITGLQKEATFNGKVVTLCEYISEQRRYRVEPVDPPDISRLPPTMLLKPQNVKVDSTNQNAVSFSDMETTMPTLFCPIVPLMEQGKVLTVVDVGHFLSEQSRSIDAALDQLSALYPARQQVKLVSVAESSVVLLCSHLVNLTESYLDSVDYVEHILKTQLIQAIGKEIGSKDFDEFMVFHSRKLFAPAFAPKPYTYAIRRSNRDPDGLISIETIGQQQNEKNEPIQTMVRLMHSATMDRCADKGERVKSPSWFIPISAATTVEITGDRYLHGWIQNIFQSETQRKHQIVARARQFSSFLLVLGTIVGADQFEPKEAIILQNKDEVLIPLLMNVLPSFQDFKDSIKSLSPGQQSFAKAFRSMQLESSVFGLCFIQIKPQIEKVLGLPMGSLTKEITLMQDLMSLFIEYQIPSDLLTFDGPDDHDADTKVATVKGHVKSVLEVVENEKKKQLKDEIQLADMRAEKHPAIVNRIPVGASDDESCGSASYIWDDNVSGESRGESYCSGCGSKSYISCCGSASYVSGESRGESYCSASPYQLNEQSCVFKLYRIPDCTGTHLSCYEHTLTNRNLASSASSRGKQLNLKAEDPLKGNYSYKLSSEYPDVRASSVDGLDFTMIPKILDSKIETFDDNNVLRSIVIKTGQSWIRTRQENLLIAQKTSMMSDDDIKIEKNKAFDLLEAISRSGELPINFAELHVLIGVSHSFENNLMGTVIEDNVNPIDNFEKSCMLLASTIYDLAPSVIIEDSSHTQGLKGPFVETNVDHHANNIVSSNDYVVTQDNDNESSNDVVVDVVVVTCKDKKDGFGPNDPSVMCTGVPLVAEKTSLLTVEAIRTKTYADMVKSKIS